ncbi:MAG: hypothetical protein KDJ99_29465 [Candidatus Competibacteraceae bacterium]|nr:hypothetical protein [Candidatus Competibacteraceae bacterium]
MGKAADLSKYQVSKPQIELTQTTQATPSATPPKRRRGASAQPEVKPLKVKGLRITQEMEREFDILVAEQKSEGKNATVLAAEMFNLLFKKYGKPTY